MSIRDVMDDIDKAYVGKTLWSRNNTEQGKIKKISNRYCAACGQNSMCLIVRWPDGKTTKPCVNGIQKQQDGTFVIQ